jgi:hypothetical protein
VSTFEQEYEYILVKEAHKNLKETAEKQIASRLRRCIAQITVAINHQKKLTKKRNAISKYSKTIERNERNERKHSDEHFPPETTQHISKSEITRFIKPIVWKDTSVSIQTHTITTETQTTITCPLSQALRSLSYANLMLSTSPN